MHFETVWTQFQHPPEEDLSTDCLSDFLAAIGLDISTLEAEQALDELDPEANGVMTRKRLESWVETHFEGRIRTTHDFVSPAPTPTLKPQEEIASEISDISQHPETKSSPKPVVKSIASAMLDVKKSRKRAQADAQLLANRLAHLRAEEERARKRILETEKRAQSILEAKEAKLRKRREKEKFNASQMSKRLETIQLNAHSASENQRRKDTRNSSLSSKTKRDGRALREEKDRLRRQLEQNRAKETAAIVRKKQAVKAQQEEALRKRQQEKAKRESEQVKRAQALLQEEHRQKILSEQIIQEMEAEEAKLIERLKHTQQRQRQAYEKLESVL